MKDSTKQTIKYIVITALVIGILIYLRVLFENDMRNQSCQLLETDPNLENFDAGYDNEIFAGEAGRVAADEAPESVKSAYSTMRWIVTIGWAIYPLGYFFGYMAGGADMATLNIIYNLADVLNKIAFGVIIWNVAVTESES